MGSEKAVKSLEKLEERAELAAAMAERGWKEKRCRRFWEKIGCGT
jgi:hypothetical protein